MCSFLPKDESDRCNLSRQGEASHRRLHAFREQALVEIVERSLAAAGHRCRTLEDGFHIVIMILIEPTNLLGLFRTLQLSAHVTVLQLSAHVTVLRTVARIDRQAAVRPQLSLAAEPMRGLHQRDQQSGPDWADRRNLAQ